MLWHLSWWAWCSFCSYLVQAFHSVFLVTIPNQLSCLVALVFWFLNLYERVILL